MATRGAGHEKNIEALSNATQLPAADVDRILRSFQIAIDVSIPLQAGSDEWTQVYLLCNLLPRIFHNVGFARPVAGDLQPIPNLQRVARAQLQQPNICLVIGDAGTIFTGLKIFLANRGWTTYLSWEEKCNDERTVPNPIAAYFTAALAVSEVFKAAFGSNLSQNEMCPSPFRYDVYNMREASGPVVEPNVFSRHWDVENLLVVGIGAVGQAFLDCLSLVPHLAGAVHLVDPDKSDEGNLQRCVFTFGNNLGHMKVDIGYDRLKQRHPFLRVRRNQTIFHRTVTTAIIDGEMHTLLADQTTAIPLTQDYGHFRQTIGANTVFPLVICAVDSAQARRDIQFGLHKVVLNGWTRTMFGALEYGIGRHVISDDRACLACRHHPDQEQPSFNDFVARRTGWSPEKVHQYLNDETLMVSMTDVQGIAATRRVPIETLLGMVGKPLGTGLHEQCGVMQIIGAQQPAPVPHLGILTGALLAVATIRELAGEGNGLHLFLSDAQRMPNKYSKRIEPPNPNCLCNDNDLRVVYQAQWS